MIAALNRLVDSTPLVMFIILCLTLGLAPFNPPHILEKMQLLFKGQLIRPLDWFDLLLHGTPWIFLVLKLIALAKGNPKTG